MRQYDSIPYCGATDRQHPKIKTGPWEVFDKEDGSNVRVEVRVKKGKFEKWGSRKVLIDPAQESNILSNVSTLFQTSYDSDAILRFLSTYNKGREDSLFTLFFEFVGPNSFAGSHDLEDNHELKILDVWQEKRGYIPPLDLLNHFEPHMPLYLGTLDEIDADFIQSVNTGALEGMGMEGVILKRLAQAGQPRIVDMVKTKRLDWIQKVQAKHGADWEKFA